MSAHYHVHHVCYTGMCSKVSLYIIIINSPHIQICGNAIKKKNQLYELIIVFLISDGTHSMFVDALPILYNVSTFVFKVEIYSMLTSVTDILNHWDR